MIPVDPDQSRFGGRHTERKLSVLGRYLNAYGTALSRTRFQRWYVDIFAGSGHREDPNAAEADGQETIEDVASVSARELPGSAHLALDATPPFDHYLFIERNPQKAELLRRLVADHPQVAMRTHVEQGDGLAALRRFCLDFDSRSSRAVLFLDPFGMQVEWEVLEAVARTRAIDCWMLFPLGAVQRLLMRERSDIPAGWQDKLDRFFGERHWRKEMYETGPVQLSLFGEAEAATCKKRSHDVLLAYTRRRLQRLFCLVNAPMILKNRLGSPIFALFFMMNNDGKKAMSLARKLTEWIVEHEQGAP